MKESSSCHVETLTMERFLGDPTLWSGSYRSIVRECFYVTGLAGSFLHFHSRALFSLHHRWATPKVSREKRENESEGNVARRLAVILWITLDI